MIEANLAVPIKPFYFFIGMWYPVLGWIYLLERPKSMTYMIEELSPNPIRKLSVLISRWINPRLCIVCTQLIYLHNSENYNYNLDGNHGYAF